MGVYIHRVNTKSQASNRQVKDIMTIQKGQNWKKINQGSYKFMHFDGKFSRGPWVQERVLLGLHISLWEYTQKVATSSPKKLLQLYLVVQRRAQLEHRSHIVKLELRQHANTCKPWHILKVMNKPADHLKLCQRNTDIWERVLNQITLSTSTVEMYLPMQVIKQPENGRTSTTKEQKWSSFQTNYD